MTDESQSEQRSAGLTDLDPATRARIVAGNARYRERFGFPFIIAVRGLGPADDTRRARPTPRELAGDRARRSPRTSATHRHAPHRAAGRRVSAESTPPTPCIDGARLLARLDQLRAIGAADNGGVTREAYGPLDVEARARVEEWMIEAGLAPTVDAAANLIGRRPGTASGGTAVATGSHLDTVVDAGAFDGAYGVVAAVEVAAALRRSGSELRHDLIVAAFANEEGARGSLGMVGSRALVGDVPAAELARPDDDGVTLAQRLRDAGGDPDHVADAAWATGAVAAFVELHIEQGPVLDTADRQLGVVTAITGRQEWMSTSSARRIMPGPRR